MSSKQAILFSSARQPEKVKDLEAAGASTEYATKDISAMGNFLGSFGGLVFRGKNKSGRNQG